MQIPTSKKDIETKRKEIEKKLSEFIEKHGIQTNFEEIKNIIYKEEDQGDLNKIISQFDLGQNIDELNDIVQVVNDAWNYFPHKILNGLSPMEMIMKNKQY